MTTVCRYEFLTTLSGEIEGRRSGVISRIGREFERSEKRNGGERRIGARRGGEGWKKGKRRIRVGVEDRHHMVGGKAMGDGPRAVSVGPKNDRIATRHTVA